MLSEDPRPFAKKSSRKNKCGIRSQEDFNEILGRERARSRRLGYGSSLIVFDFSDGIRGWQSAVCSLFDSLNRRKRLIDRVGWIDKRRVGVLLSGTLPEGAKQLADCILQQYAEGGSPFVYKVYPFPSDWSIGRKGNVDDFQGEGGAGLGPGQCSDPSGRRLAMEEGFLRRPLPFWKRSMDIVGAVVGLFLLSPVFLIVGLLIKFVSPGPVFFRQERIGCDGASFAFFKFRTMHPNRSESSHQQYLAQLIAGSSGDESGGAAMTKMEDDPRIIPMGRVLRNSCIDELPQLVNVLRGDMSLVGPRPPIPYEVAEYLRWHGGRFDAIPGMTGLWQVSGKNSLSFKEMVRLDIRYARESSFWLDLRILFKTPLAIFSQVMGGLKSPNLSPEGD